MESSRCGRRERPMCRSLDCAITRQRMAPICWTSKRQQSGGGATLIRPPRFAKPGPFSARQEGRASRDATATDVTRKINANC
jgi:hypothetical protein